MNVDQLLKPLQQRAARTDVILVHLDSFFRIKYSYYNMGLLYIATYLRHHGYRVKCLGIQHFYRMNHNDIRQVFTLSRPALVGFYTASDNILMVEDFAAQVKRWCPRSTVVVGGPYAASVGSDVLNCPHIDVCCLSEGEYPMKLLADHLIGKKGTLEEIPGLVYRNGSGVKRNCPPPALTVAELDELPRPDFSMIMAPGQSVFQVVSGRGCPFGCVFCFNGVHGIKYRQRPADTVSDEIISNLETHPFKAFEVIDDTFISRPSRVREMANRMADYRASSGRDFIFFCQARVDVLDKHPDLLSHLRAAGLARLQVGLETGDPEVMKTYDKKINHDQTRRVVKHLYELGDICLAGNFILGGPRETETTFQNTLDVAKELMGLAPGMVEVGAGFMGPYPGTDIAADPDKYGLKDVERDRTFKKGLSLSDVHMTTEAFDLGGMRRLGRRFDREITAHMSALVGRMTRKTILTHFEWARRYRLETFFYTRFLSKFEALNNYFDYTLSPRFVTWKEIPPHEILDWFPQRVVESRVYTDDGCRLRLPASPREIELVRPEEILVYELASGKLRVKTLLEEFREETGSPADNGEILQNIVMPTFEKLDDLFQLVFYR